MVEDNEKTNCFDAVWIVNEKMIVVDCVKKTSDGLKNIFIYVNSTSHKVIRQQATEMFVDYT